MQILRLADLPFTSSGTAIMRHSSQQGNDEALSTWIRSNLHPTSSPAYTITMSGPAGSGSSANAGLAGLVHRAVNTHKSSGSSPKSSVDDVAPSKGLPSTGLKRNTREWQEDHRKSRGQRKGTGESQSSSSSIPSNATGSIKDPEALTQQTTPESETKMFGTGKKEMTDEPEELEPPSTQETSRSVSPTPPKHGPTFATEKSKDAYGTARVTKAKVQAPPSSEPQESEIDPEEKMMRRDEMEVLKDEVGRSPDKLAAVKSEEPPGPRTTIELNTRIPHQHVSASSP